MTTAAAKPSHRTALAAALLLAAACTPPERGAGGATPQDPEQPARTAGQTKETDPMDRPDDAENLETATLGAGCFWCIEAVLERIDGIASVQSGYMGGQIDNPTYEAICTGTTGHAEVVQVRYDPEQIRYEQLLAWFFKAHDPTTLNRQGPDRGTQYRSAIFFHSDGQRALAERAKEKAQVDWSDPIVTEITAASTFWPAEEYHQDFFAKNPNQAYCNALIPPKLEKLGLDDKQPGGGAK